MAIDDNTSYELTGEQVKDLASKINAKADSSSLATVATSGLYSDLSGTPTIPTKTSDLTNDGADNTSTYVEADELATVATSGSYADLSNKPTIPAAQVNSDWDAVSGVAQILNKPSLATVATSGLYSDLTGTPSLATVATSGDYDDLLDKPTIPTVNDATLTITQNGTSAGTFTANASSNTTIALTDTTYSAMTGATSGTAGASGLVPAPAAGDNTKFLQGDGTWATPNAGGVFDCYVNKTLASTWTAWNIYDSTSYTTTLDSVDISNQLLGGKRVVVHTSDSSPYTFEIISQYDDSVPCYDFIVSFDGVLKKMTYSKISGWWSFASDVVNDATLTIQHNGTTVDTFTANASANKTVNIETIYADTITPTTAVATIGTTQIADAAVTSSKIDWNSAVSSAAFASLGEPAHLTDITNNSKLVGDRLLSVNFKAKITTSNSSYVQVGQFTSLPHNIGYEAALSVQQEGTTNIFRYAYLESNGKFVVATGSAVSNQTIRVSGFIPLIGT